VALINAAAALVVAEASDDLEAGFHAAAESVDSGKARQKLDEFLQFRAAQ
jgi:anthranilate phosphoribosyltransferase